MGIRKPPVGQEVSYLEEELDAQEQKPHPDAERLGFLEAFFIESLHVIDSHHRSLLRVRFNRLRQRLGDTNG